MVATLVVFVVVVVVAAVAVVFVVAENSCACVLCCDGVWSNCGGFGGCGLVSVFVDTVLRL